LDPLPPASRRTAVAVALAERVEPGPTGLGLAEPVLAGGADVMIVTTAGLTARPPRRRCRSSGRRRIDEPPVALVPEDAGVT